MSFSHAVCVVKYFFLFKCVIFLTQIKLQLLSNSEIWIFAFLYFLNLLKLTKPIDKVITLSEYFKGERGEFYKLLGAMKLSI